MHGVSPTFGASKWRSCLGQAPQVSLSWPTMCFPFVSISSWSIVSYCGQNPALPEKPWNDDALVNTNKQWFSWILWLCRISSIHSTPRRKMCWRRTANSVWKSSRDVTLPPARRTTNSRLWRPKIGQSWSREKEIEGRAGPCGLNWRVARLSLGAKEGSHSATGKEEIFRVFLLRTVSGRTGVQSFHTAVFLLEPRRIFQMQALVQTEGCANLKPHPCGRVFF